MELPNRKTVRLKGYDYNTPGYYFVTICTKEKRKILCDIVGTVVPDGPQIQLTEYGRIADQHLQAMADFYENIRIDKYVIMPNHIHLLIHILDCNSGLSEGSSPATSRLSRFIGTFKRFCNKEYGTDIWQARSNDHVVRGEKDYAMIWEYIHNNPVKWADDCFYSE